MVFRFLHFFIFFSITSAFANSAVDGFFYLRNGDVIQGRNPMFQESGLEFFAANLDADIRLKPENLLAWRVANAKPVNPENSSSVFFLEGDSVDVRILSLDDAWLEVETAWGQPNAIRVADLSRITLPDTTQPLYQGPQPLAAFQSPNTDSKSFAGWLEGDGGVFNRSERRTMLELPIPNPGDVFRVSMDVVLRGPSDLALDLVGTGLRTTGPDWVFIRQRQDQLTVSGRTAVGSLSSGASALPETSADAYRVELYVNVRENRYAVRWNGVLIRELRERPADPAETFAFNRLRILFAGNNPVMIRELTLTSWDGTLPQDRAVVKEGARVLFRNQDGLSSKEIRIQEGTLRLTPEEGFEISLPLERIAELVFPTPDGEPVNSPPFDAELRLAFPGNWLKVSGLEIRDGDLLARHPSFRDPLRIPLNRMQGIEWAARSPEPPGDEAKSATLRLLSGEHLRGDFLGFSEQYIRFRPGWRETPVTIPRNAVGLLTLSGSDAVADAPHRFRFKNRSSLRGTLSVVSENELILQTFQGEAVTVNRGEILEISRVDGMQGDWVYSWGEEDDWQFNRRGRAGRDPTQPTGRALARGGIVYARSLPTDPERVTLDLRIEPNAGLGLLWNVFASGPGRENPVEGVEVNISSRQISFRAPDQFEFFNYERTPNEPNRLQFFFDPPEGRILVFLNGEEIKTLDIPLPRRMRSRWMWFQSIVSDFSPEGLQVQPWSGEPSSGPPIVDVRTFDDLLLADAPLIRGQQLPSARDQLAFLPEGETAIRTFPIQDMQRVRFRTDERAAPDPGPGEIHVSFRGESLPLTLIGIEGDKERIVGTGEAWPTPVSLPLRFINSIRFNPVLSDRMDLLNEPVRWMSFPDSEKALQTLE